ncbi:MAG TPA: 2TM domain-containing protein [Candidatus Deferrimicrobium sp.]|nr:2TM domain-containing protein [Candidatus Deferrimicrobium sp.]
MSENIEFSEESLRRIAEEKINFRNTVKIHVWAFILTSIVLVILNLIFTPEFLWSIIAILGWLIGVAEHAAAYQLYANGVLPMAKRGVIFHAIAWGLGIIFLLTVNYLIAGTISWALFPVFFWAVGLIAHLIVYNYYNKSADKVDKGKLLSRKERAIEKEMQKMREKMKSEGA